MAVGAQGETSVKFATFLPELAEGQAVATDLINGTNNQKFLTGDGSTSFKVSLNETLTSAGYDNSLGVYEVDATGAIMDAQLLVTGAKSMPSATIDIDQVEAGHQLGFFLVQDGASWADGLAETDTFSFINTSDGSVANVEDGANVQLAVNGVDAELTVFHSFSETLNSDGLHHVLSGVNSDRASISLGFEDLLNVGDVDFQDLVFSVETFEML